MIAGLFTDLLPAGGVQRAGRLTAAVLLGWARRRGGAAHLLSLADPRGTQRAMAGGEELVFRAYAGSKAAFAAAALGHALRRPRVVLAGHPHLAPVAAMMKRAAGGMRGAVVAHGAEVWTPLAAYRRAALRTMDCVLAPSRDTARALTEVQGVEAARIAMLPWPLDPEFTAAAQTAPGQGAGAENHLPREFPPGPVVLTVGRLAAADRDKGVDTLIAALARLGGAFPHASLAVVGEGGDRPRLERLAREQGVAPRVRFLGRLTAEALFACYRHCDVFALPSRKEGFGLVFLEAMAFGKPVIGGAHGGAPDIIRENDTGYLVEHGDTSALAARLALLLGDEGHRREMGARAQAYVRAAHGFEQFRAALERILDGLCAS